VTQVFNDLPAKI
jgi:hypothetical protein